MPTSESRVTTETDVSKVAADARRVLTINRQSGQSEWDGRTYDFVCPSPRSYPFQWLWDSCFHAIALLTIDPELAKQELRCLLQGAQPDGFLPHMLLWVPSTRRRSGRRWLASARPKKLVSSRLPSGNR